MAAEYHHVSLRNSNLFEDSGNCVQQGHFRWDFQEFFEVFLHDGVPSYLDDEDGSDEGIVVHQRAQKLRLQSNM